MGETDKNSRFENNNKSKPDNKSHGPSEEKPAVTNGGKKTWRDMIPSLSETNKKKLDLNAGLTDEEKKALRGNNINAIPIIDITYKNTDENFEGEKIPKFDLAEKIMAQQRKVTAKKRKGPGQIDAKTEEIHSETLAQPLEIKVLRKTEDNDIIAEIVARDIERLCRGKVLT